MTEQLYTTTFETNVVTMSIPMSVDPAILAEASKTPPSQTVAEFIRDQRAAQRLSEEAAEAADQAAAGAEAAAAYNRAQWEAKCEHAHRNAEIVKKRRTYGRGSVEVVDGYVTDDECPMCYDAEAGGPYNLIAYSEEDDNEWERICEDCSYTEIGTYTRRDMRSRQW